MSNIHTKHLHAPLQIFFNLQPLDFVVWRPMTSILTDVFAIGEEMNRQTLQAVPTAVSGGVMAGRRWPQIHGDVGRLRVIFPAAVDSSDVLILQVDAVQIQPVSPQ